MPNNTPAHASQAQTLHGAGAALGACLSWGLVPIYWKALHAVPAVEVLAHRTVWAALFASTVVLAGGGLRRLRQALSQRHAIALSFASGTVISLNGFAFIWAVNHGYVLQASLGYFINPLVSVALGVLFLHERLRRVQEVAVLLAGLGVLALGAMFGQIPWVAMGIACTFASYGILRKISPLDSLQGFAVEACCMAPVALGYLSLLARHDTGTFAQHRLLLIGCGPITALPLLLFAYAARRLHLASLGLFQYVTPTCQLLLATALYNERLTYAHAVGFPLIWSGLLLYSADALRRR